LWVYSYQQCNQEYTSICDDIIREFAYAASFAVPWQCSRFLVVILLYSVQRDSVQTSVIETFNLMIIVTTTFSFY